MTTTAEIIGTGSYLPGDPVCNKELKKKVKNFDTEKAKISLEKKGLDVNTMSEDEVFDEWALMVTGIRQRHFIAGTDTEGLGATEFMAREASKKALEDAGVKPSELDLVIFGTFTPDDIIPNPACTLAHLIGADGTPGIPVNTACSSFIDGLGDAYYRLKSDDYNTILVVASEALTLWTDYGDPTTAVLFADGAGAAVLRKSEKGIRSFASKTQYSVDHITLKNDCSNIGMGGGPNVLKQAINAMSEAADVAMERAGLTTDDLDYLIPHQANLRIIQGLARKLKCPEDRTCVTIDNFGNTSGASLAVALDKVRRGEVPGYKIQKGDLVLLATVGGGYTFSGLIFEN